MIRRIYDRPQHYRAARAGRLPAEALTARDRRTLIADLASHGWTTPEIARHTGWSTYTATRIAATLPPRLRPATGAAA